jgi:GTP-binding protein
MDTVMVPSAPRQEHECKSLVAIVGRPNVGKSTLFNRFTGRRIAIVDDRPGVTRDRIYGEVEWDGRVFDVVDTGGLVHENTDRMERHVYEQILKAIQDAACIIFVTDAGDGVTPGDKDVALVLKKTDKPVIVAVNKADNKQRALVAAEMYSLGFDEPYPISALHGVGIGELLDTVCREIPHQPVRESASAPIRIAIVGQPNVGKSSLVNALLREQRVIVDEQAGTTRDSVDIHFHRKGENYTLIDTAGLRKPSRVRHGIEHYSVKRALASIRRCDVALLLIDTSATSAIAEQDCRIANQIDSQGCAQVIALNKWDLGEKDHRTFDRYVDLIHRKMPNLSYVPVISISAKTGLRLHRIFDEIQRVHAHFMSRIPTSTLNDFLQDVFRVNRPPLRRGVQPKLLYATQASVAPPTFVLFMNRSEMLNKTYLRYLENRLRDQFQFAGTPLRVETRTKARK